MSEANKIYNDLCAALDSREWKYTRHDDELYVTFSVSGDDLPMDFSITVDEDRNLVRLLSRLPIVFPEDKRIDGAVAASVASYGLYNGAIDFDIENGKVYYRQVSSYRGSELGNDHYQDMIDCAVSIVDRYNERFFMLAKGMIDIQAFIDKDN